MLQLRRLCILELATPLHRTFPLLLKNAVILLTSDEGLVLRYKLSFLSAQVLGGENRRFCCGRGTLLHRWVSHTCLQNQPTNQPTNHRDSFPWWLGWLDRRFQVHHVMINLCNNNNLAVKGSGGAEGERRREKVSQVAKNISSAWKFLWSWNLYLLVLTRPPSKCSTSSTLPLAPSGFWGGAS